MAKAIVVNQERCLGCRSCMIACAMAHTEVESLAEALQSDERPQPRVHVEPLEEGAMPLQCRHCEDAPCVAACPTGAIHRYSEDGPVVLDTDRCIGCRFCVLVCPFGVIELSRGGSAMIKCDQCIERTEAGEEPACVAACPTRALKFVEIDSWLRERRREAAERVREVSAAARDAPTPQRS